MIYGNHDMVYRNETILKKKLSTYFDARKGKDVPLFPNIKYYEGIVLENSETKQELFLTHGHQADFLPCE